MGLMSLEAWLDALLALLPPSSALNRAVTGVLARTLAACGAAFREAQRFALSILAQFDPLLADELLGDWERLYALPDECLNAPVDINQRRQRVNARRLMVGDARPEYFRQLVIDLGYPDARIEEFRPFRVNSKCTDPINQGGWRYAWRVHIVDAANVMRATATSKCNVPLRAWGDPGLICLLRRYGPAHTVVFVGYDEIL